MPGPGASGHHERAAAGEGGTRVELGLVLTRPGYGEAHGPVRDVLVGHGGVGLVREVVVDRGGTGEGSARVRRVVTDRLVEVLVLVVGAAVVVHEVARVGGLDDVLVALDAVGRARTVGSEAVQ